MTTQPPIFQEVYFDPTTGGGIPAAIGTIVQLKGGTQAWAKSGAGNTDWVSHPSAGGGGTADGVSIDGNGTVSTPFSVIPSYIQGLVAPSLPKAGANLTDASVSKNPASDAASVYTLPAATLSANRVLTLGVTGSPVTNSVVQVIRRDLTNKTYTVQDDVASSLIVFGASPASPQGATFYFDGTHFKLLNFFYVAA
jgi:hypothetical protein